MVQTKIISLDKRPERLQATIGELSKLGIDDYEWFPAIEGGASGCDKSHYACLKDGDGDILILEDDCVFEDDALEIMNMAVSQLPADFDLLYLGANVKSPAKRWSNNLYKIEGGVHTTHALLWSADGRKKMLELYNPETNDGFATIDHWMFMKGQSLMKCFVVWPMIAFQRAGYSDIRMSEQDYKQEMLNNQAINMA